MLADDVIDAAIANPFAVDHAPPAPMPDAEVVLFVERALASGQTRAAKRALLAAAHLRACAAPDDPGRAIPASIVSAHPALAGEVLRVAMAAGRCHRALERIAGRSKAMRDVRSAVWSACFGSSLFRALDLMRVIVEHDVLVMGETGTGKELVAHAIQEAMFGPPDGGKAPHASVNAAAIPETLLESELFGHQKGAFTGAIAARKGRLRAAHGGSFFLDEVGDLPTTTQVKLLRVMEANEVQPIGSDESYDLQVRYVAATHKDLPRMVREGVYRRDFYERMAGNVIEIPPLRARPEDIGDIGRAFVLTYLTSESDHDEQRAIDRWLESDEARSAPLPGNVRELQNALRDLLLGVVPRLSREEPSLGPITGDVPARVRDGAASLTEVRDWYLGRVLSRTRANYAAAARILGVDRSTVRRLRPPGPGTRREG